MTLPDELRGDGPCQDCGTLENIVWHTDNVLWNAVTGENVVHEQLPAGILCVPCFVTRFARAGYHTSGWRVSPEWTWERLADHPGSRAARMALPSVREPRDGGNQ